MLLLTTTIFSMSFGVYQPCGHWVLLRCAKHNSTKALRVLSKTQPGWIMNIPAVGLIGSPLIILAIGYWLLAIGYGLEYAACRYSCLSPLTFRLIAVSPHHIITFTL